VKQPLSLDGLLAAAQAVRAGAAARDPWLSGLRVLGIGWATVELERAAQELLEAFSTAGLPDPQWEPAPREGLLGATAWAEPGDAARPAIVLLEPDTESRLAATLARFGEGVAAVYVEPARGDAVQAARLGRPTPGPLGMSRIVLAGPTWGPHVIVVERPRRDSPR
jgi:hypothetical protein